MSRCFSRRQSRAVGDAKNVGIDGNCRAAESDVQHDIGCFLTDPRKTDKRIEVVRDLSVKIAYEDLTSRNDVFGLVTE